MAECHSHLKIFVCGFGEFSPEDFGFPSQVSFGSLKSYIQSIPRHNTNTQHMAIPCRSHIHSKKWERLESDARKILWQ